MESSELKEIEIIQETLIKNAANLKHSEQPGAAMLYFNCELKKRNFFKEHELINDKWIKKNTANGK